MEVRRASGDLFVLSCGVMQKASLFFALLSDAAWRSFYKDGALFPFHVFLHELQPFAVWLRLLLIRLPQHAVVLVES